MEYLPSEIARLVLGYLEDEKCESAYDVFLKTSPHLTECLRMRETGRKFRTCITMSLTQILNEYLSISSTVNERLEKVDPEAADSLRNSGNLLDKITFLLNANTSGQTMLFSITLPHGKSPSKSAVAHVRKRFKSSNIEKTKERRKPRQNENDSLCEELNESKNKLSDVDTTPLYSLPGHASCMADDEPNPHKQDEGINKTPKRKGSSALRKPKALPETKDENLDFSILTKALLDNHEFHEKLAENINKVRTPDVVETIASTSTAAPPVEHQVVDVGGTDSGAATGTIGTGTGGHSIYQSSFYTELDNAFKKIVNDTEADPVFRSIVSDVFTEETSDECEDKGISHTSTPQKHATDPELTSADNDKVVPSKIIDDQNFDAIQSIIAVNSKLQHTGQDLNNTMDSMLCDSHLNTSSTSLATSSGAAVVVTSHQETPSDNSNVAKPHQTVAQSQGYIMNAASSNIVVITQAASSVVTRPTYVLANSSYSTMNNQLVVLGKPAPQYVMQPQTTVLTERDIMAMPTLIMYGDTGYALQQPLYKKKQPPPPPPRVVEIAPKPGPQQQQSQVSITLYAGGEETRGGVHISVSPAKSTATSSAVTTSSSSIAGKSVPMISLDSAIKEIATPDVSTPAPPTGGGPAPRQSTPRSGQSHVRALDFGTSPSPPPSPAEGTRARTASGRKKPKKSLFTANPLRRTASPLKLPVPIATRVPTARLTGGWDNVHGTGLILGTGTATTSTRTAVPARRGARWDQDLRALCAADQPAAAGEPTTRNKRKRDPLNKTAEQVCQIEEALLADMPPSSNDAKKKAKGKTPRSKSKNKSTKKVTKTPSVANDSKPQPEVKPEKSPPAPDPNVRNMRSRVNKKCNIGDSMIAATEEVPKTILSPSKLKPTHKRSIVQKDSGAPPDMPLPDKITPVTCRESCELPVTFKTDLTAALETPLKSDLSTCPITPRLLPGEQTPFTKILNENLGSVDLSTIPTPNFPITPSFSSLTPSGVGAGSGTAATDDDRRYDRPTDYSTSSSYYQPSDQEHAHVLDTILIEEAKTLERRIQQEAANQQEPLDVEVHIAKSIIDKATPNKSAAATACSCSSESDSSYTSCTSSSSGDEPDTTVMAAEPEPEPASPKGYMLRSRRTPFKDDAKKKMTPIKISISKKQVTKLPKNSLNSSSCNDTPQANVVDNSPVETPLHDEPSVTAQMDISTDNNKCEIRSFEKPTEDLNNQLNNALKLACDEVKIYLETVEPQNDFQTKSNEDILTSPSTEKSTVTNIVLSKYKKSNETSIKTIQPRKSGIRVARRPNKIDPTALETLEEKRLRTLKGIKNQHVKKHPPAKRATKLKTEVTTTKAKKSKVAAPDKEARPKRKATSIETIASKLKDQMVPSQSAVDKDHLNESVKIFEYEEMPSLQLCLGDEDMADNQYTHAEDKKLQDLKERGIHLIPNNAKCADETQSNSETKNKVLVHNVVVLNKHDLIDLKKIESEKCVKTNIITKQTKSVAESDTATDNLHDTSETNGNKNNSAFCTVDMNFDNRLITEEAADYFHLTYDPGTACKRTLEDYDIPQFRNKSIAAKVYSEELEIEQMRTISNTRCYDLFTQFPQQPSTDIKGKNTISLKQYKSRLSEQNAETTNQEEDELFELALLGSARPDRGHELNWKKRKLLGDTSTPKQTPEKRLKPDDKISLLHGVDLDKFLTKVHGPFKE